MAHVHGIVLCVKSGPPGVSTISLRVASERPGDEPLAVGIFAAPLLIALHQLPVKLFAFLPVLLAFGQVGELGGILLQVKKLLLASFGIPDVFPNPVRDRK